MAGLFAYIKVSTGSF